VLLSFQMISEVIKVIAYLRKKRGLSQAQLANLLGVGQSAVAMWENGENTPRPEKLIAMSKIFNCSIETLLQPCGKEAGQNDDSGVCGAAWNVGRDEGGR